MTGLSKEDLKAVLEEVFEERSRIDSSKHCEHHDWIHLQIEKERQKLKQRQELIKWLKAVRSRILEWSLYAVAFAVLTKLITGHWPDNLPGG